jgi:hypothetical protein
MKAFTTTPAAATMGLDLFAAAWLERWNSYGGTITVTAEGRAMAGSPCEHLDGTRELLDLLAIVPGGKAAVTAHVRRYPVGAGNGMVFA